MNFNIKEYFKKGDTRSLSVKRNITASLFLKGINIIISLLVVPITINYINTTQYGIWMTLSSIIAWLSYFDLGFAHGFRNRFAEAVAKNEKQLAKEYVSTTYASLSIIFISLLIIILIINNFIDWSHILNIDNSYKNELRVVFALLAGFFCVNIIASVFTTMLTADQKPALVSLIQTGGQFLAMVCIIICTKTTEGSLSTLVFLFSGIPCLLIVVISLISFHKGKYKTYAPSIKGVRFSLVPKILGLGGQFFVIMISMLFIFQFTNIILSRIEGPVAVTQYNIAYKYFNTLNMTAVIILTPFWSAFTDAYTKKDYAWMKNMQNKLEKLWLLCIPILIVMTCFSSPFFKLWIGDTVNIPLSLSVCMGTYVLCQTAGNLYMYLINGTSKVRLQMIVYVIFAIIAIPLMSLSCQKFGLTGIIIIPSIVFFTQAIIGKIQIKKLINGTASGIFNK